ncbi:sensor histidine kinase [Oharaeibacter diazotrophicus]|uniref:histidine kinase n=3 Tax=Oharaeibacter diazotrophicus TaxID=1920512 RepID=A0A4V3CVN9_9HYPH|nr:sensor histidine kinase [Oharaeibacter diazotrophicus]TDP83208.1 signal transduction histidine kinase [Oharaeibacter diazotrophicus]BBE72037.1 sensor protein PhoQ [Pleomorphomonas sp. SM30]GLS78802.1 ATPase [Oharaeibacter diazotrophicus]
MADDPAAAPAKAPLRRGVAARGSLALRLMLVSAVWSAIALAVAGLVLTELYRTDIVRGFDARLEVYQKTIAGRVAATPAGETPDPGSLGEPRFLLPLTGWYWMIRDAVSGTTVAASRSLYGELLDVPSPPPDGTPTAAFVRGPVDADLRLSVQRVTVGERRYDVVVTGNADEIRTDVAAFGRRVFVTLAVLAAGLLVASVLQVRIGLRPLERMRAALADIRAGRNTRLPSDLPSEIAPLGQELNALIETNVAVVERARGHVGNLAHALKTPLSVMLNEARAEDGPLAGKVVEQVQLMRAQVDRHLDRARVAAERRVVGAAADLGRSLEGLANVLRRAHADRAVDIVVTAPPALRARIERRDLEDVVGNLMDNACKYGRGRVRVAARGETDALAARPMVTVTVEDDGPGVPETRYAEVLGRGRRLDETVPGSGLGLAIADEIVEAYGGTMMLGRSELGGLAVAVRLPQS